MAKTKVSTYTVDTCMGCISYVYGDPLSFLNAKELKELDCIGYTGRGSDGQRTTWEDYLNSLGKGTFNVTQTKFDNGSFQEQYIISRSYDED